MSKTGIKVFAPATVANMACGYDLMGFALEQPGDEIIGRLVDNRPGVHITNIYGDKGKLSRETMQNTASVAAQKFLDHIGDPTIGIEMDIYKKMPFGSGMGSSAASAAAGVMLANELLKRPLRKQELMPFAVAGEQVADGAYHADNVAPSLLGGIVFIRDNATLDFHRVTAPPGLYATVVHPHIQVLTKDSRDILSETVTLEQSITQNGNLGGLIIGLYRGDFDLIKRSLQDVIIEPQRAKLIPGFYDVKDAALQENVLGCSISGAGPSIFALSNNNLNAENAGNAMQRAFAKHKIESTVYISKINSEGAVLY